MQFKYLKILAIIRWFIEQKSKYGICADQDSECTLEQYNMK